MALISESAPLTVRICATPGGAAVELVGVADLNAVTAMRDALLGAVESFGVSRHRVLTVDMRQVDYVDSAGLSALVAAAKALTPAAGALRVLVTRGGQPDRVLHLVRFDTIMSITREA